MAHSVSSASSTPPAVRSAGAEEPSVGTLVQSAMADMSTLVRSEIELAKAEIGKSAKKAGISIGLFAAAGVLVAFAGIYFFVTVAEALTALGLPRWISYGIVTVFLLLLAGVCALIGKRMLKKIEKPERTMETLSDLPDVLHREAPGERHRAVPEVSNGRVKRAGTDSYTV
ncbi:phage holin family protein [Blastococcus haudaquaticus]|uniref:Holin-X, holin superfamily III n=1 Tax=Blastococcus haudaquaticus TaxID=1938745 RepID=A0A286GYL3_9ACTN|nr:phage holin family protein [Blastococcus haudaquaticus]SOE00615.1 Putative Holin-X, holin superfamily III [Blastococcus haudaquaticus]